MMMFIRRRAWLWSHCAGSARGAAQLRRTEFYINGRWVPPAAAEELTVTNPATEAPLGLVSAGTAKDVDAAVTAARRAWPDWSASDKDTRLALLRRLAEIYASRKVEMAATISAEMGCPMKLATSAQAAAGLGHIKHFIRVLEHFQFEEKLSMPDARPDAPAEWLMHESVGVCGLITPWNWPMNQVTYAACEACVSKCQHASACVVVVLALCPRSAP